jgi:hypothetical protein
MRGGKMDSESRPGTPPPRYTSRAPSIRPPQYTSRAPSIRTHEPTERTPLFPAQHTNRARYSATYTEIRIRRVYNGGKRDGKGVSKVLSCLVAGIFWACVVGGLVLGGRWVWTGWFGGEEEVVKVVRVGIVGKFFGGVLLPAI